MATPDELLTDALRLPSKDRARLAHELLLSLEERTEDPDAEAGWAREIERRVHEVTSGKVTLVSVDEARRAVTERLERVRKER